MKTTLKINDLVKLKNPINEFEKQSIYIITNINKDTNRALIQITNSNLPIAPTELISISELLKFNL